MVENGTSIVTGANGYYEFWCDAGEYHAEFCAPNKVTRTSFLTATAGSYNYVEMTMFSGAVTGTVVDSDGNPLAGAYVYYYQYTNGYGYSTTYTDSNGRFTYYTEENPSYCYISKDDLNPITLWVEIQEGDIVNIGNIELLPPVYQYFVTFSQNGLDSSVGSNPVLTIGSVTYTYNELPIGIWLDIGTTFSWSSLIGGGSGKQFVLSSSSGLVSPITAPGTVTVNYDIQYQVTVTSEHGSTEGTGWYNAGSIVTISTTSPSVGYGERYLWQGWVGSGPDSYTGDILFASLTVNSPITEIACWTHQYQLTMVTNIGSTAPSAGVTWYNAGSVVSITAIAPSAGVDERYMFKGWIGSGSISYTGMINPVTVTINEPITETASWAHQYKVTFKQRGIDSSAGSNMVLTVGSVTYRYYSLPTGIWIDSGTTFSWSSPISGGPGKQFVLTGSSGLTSPITAPGTATGAYKTQFQLKVTSAHGSTQPISGTWFDSGTVVKVSVNSPADQSGGTRYRCTGWSSGTGSVLTSGLTTSFTFKINAPSSLTWNWVAQYQVTFDALGNVKADSPVPIVIVNGVFQRVPFTLWVDSGTRISYSFISPIPSYSSPNERYVWSSTSGLGQTSRTNTFTVNAPGTIFGTYMTQHKVTITQLGIGADFNGAVLRVDGIAYTRSSLPLSLWWNEGSQHTVQYLSPLMGNTYKYTLTSTTGTSAVGTTTSQNGVTTITVTGSGTITGNYSKIKR